MSDDKKEGDKHLSISSKFIWALIGGAVVFVLSGIVEPTLQRIGESARDKVLPSPGIFMSACAPLETAYRVYRAFNSETGNDIAIKQEDSEANNSFFVYIFNLTEATVNDVEMTLIPFFDLESVKDYSSISVSTNSLAGSQKYEIKRGKNGEMIVAIDSLPSGEGIVVEGVLYSILDLHVEFRAKELSVRKYFPRGCNELTPAIELKQVYSIYEVKSGYCDDSASVVGGEFICKSNVEFPQEIFEHLEYGAGIEATQYKNGEIEFVSRYDPSRIPDSPLKSSIGRDGLIFEVTGPLQE